VCTKDSKSSCMLMAGPDMKVVLCGWKLDLKSLFMLLYKKKISLFLILMCSECTALIIFSNYCLLFVYRNISERLPGRQTNQRAEIHVSSICPKILPCVESIIIYSSVSTLAFRNQLWSCEGSTQNTRSCDFRQIVCFRFYCSLLLSNKQ